MPAHVLVPSETGRSDQASTGYTEAYRRASRKCMHTELHHMVICLNFLPDFCGFLRLVGGPEQLEITGRLVKLELCDIASEPLEASTLTRNSGLRWVSSTRGCRGWCLQMKLKMASSCAVGDGAALGRYFIFVRHSATRVPPTCFIYSFLLGLVLSDKSRDASSMRC